MLVLALIARRLIEDSVHWAFLLCRSAESIRAENLFLRRQLALYIERGVRARRIDAATRVSLALLARRFDWRSSLVVVKPATLLRWHRAGWRLFWRLKSQPGRPAIPKQLQTLIRRMAQENPSWGEERIANELRLKLSIRVSSRTVRKYMPRRSPGRPRGDLRWSTFLKSHATAIVACDFFVAITATFRMLYVFVVIEHGTRRLAHVNVTAHPSADWTLQQLREVVADTDYRRYLIHDRDRIFAKRLDERVIGTIRRECLDWLIPLTESHLRAILREWVAHYNRGRPHSALGPGVPDPPGRPSPASTSEARHHLPGDALVRAKPVLGGLHHEYSLETIPVTT
jgi:putative transposase